MRTLLALVAMTAVAHAGRPCPPDDEDCPPQAVKLVHPLFAWHLGLRGGPNIGALYNFKDGKHDPATRRFVVGWQVRGDLVGLPGRVVDKAIELLYGLHVRWRPGSFELVPSLEAVARAPSPLGYPGLAVGIPISFRDRTEVGGGLYWHMHIFAIDYYLGVEIYPRSDDVTRAVLGIQLTL